MVTLRLELVILRRVIIFITILGIYAGTTDRVLVLTQRSLIKCKLVGAVQSTIWRNLQKSHLEYNHYRM